MAEKRERPLSVTPVTCRLSDAIRQLFNDFLERLHDRDGAIDIELRTLCTQLIHAHGQCMRQQDDATRETLLRNARIRCGWYGDEVGQMFVDQHAKVPNKFNLLLKLVLRNKNWYQLADSELESRESCDSPGVFAFFHRDIPALKYASADSESMLESIQTMLDDALHGTVSSEHDAVFLCCLLCSNASEWTFHFRPCDRRRLKELLLTEMLQHDTLWPAGLNTTMPQTTECVNILRNSVATGSWPPNDATLTRPSSAEHEHEHSRECYDCRGRRLTLTFTSLNAFQFCELFVQNEPRLYASSESRLQKLFELARHVKIATSFAEQDRALFDHLGSLYRELLQEKQHQLACTRVQLSKRDGDQLDTVDTVSNAAQFKGDLRHQSGWWAGNARQADTVVYSSATHLDLLTNVLLQKTKQTQVELASASFLHVLDEDVEVQTALQDERGGVYWLVHKQLPAFRFVNFTRSKSVLDAFRCFLNATFNADWDYFANQLEEPLTHAAYLASCCLLVTKASEWHFSFCPAPLANAKQRRLRADLDNVESLYNDLVIRLDSFWPHGLNATLLISEHNLLSLRQSCRNNPLPPTSNI